MLKRRETEIAYARQSTEDKQGEFSYLYTPECKNMWYSTITDPMYRNNCLCPKCGKVVQVKFGTEQEENEYQRRKISC